MNYFYDPKEQERLLGARESFSGRLLTDAQFDEAIAITGIVEREIQKNGAFTEKLGDYAYAFARTENFDAVKAETILRDLFKARMWHTDRTKQGTGARNPPEPESRPDGGQPTVIGRVNTADTDDAVSAVEGLDRYLVHLAHLDMSLPMKIELLRALQAIMRSFVDRAFGDDPVQQVAKQHARAEGRPNADDAGGEPPVVDLAPTITPETDNDLTGAFRDHAGRGERK